jgi:hypothetical protein
MLLLTCCLLFGMGVWGLFHHWGTLAQTQLKLDRCAGKAAQDLKRALERTQKLNQAIRIARKSMAVGVLAPEAIAPIKTGLQAAYVAQEAVLVSWRVRQAVWMAHGCSGTQGFQKPLPSMPFSREPPDPIGPRPLRWSGDGDGFKIQADHRPRHSAASVKGENPNEDGPHQWSLEWTEPDARVF